mmetsp:Transcript_12451/g.33072  ORF Transcript_12451/g.33072 Transcript_12451/m.33072 type:complete len:456 (-) Transcript_12451:319-1686(-)
MASESITTPDPEGEREALRREILETRNGLYEKGGTVIFSQILGPILHHGSSLIYAPDEALWKAPGNTGTAKGAMKKFLAPLTPAALKQHTLRKIFFLVVFGAAAVMLKKHSLEIKCWTQNTFLGWAELNKEMAWWMRGLSICLMMVLRLAVSNVLPFTSPAFAYLIAVSQPKGEDWKGVFYLLICSAPAGAVLPMLDAILYWVTSPCIKERDDKKNHFIATEFCSALTDYLPFSFWVRPYFMEPAFESVHKDAKKSPECAAATAVLAGHFMIWSGPATTMYSRKFVPDWLTAIMIQPLGMTEDVAVVLATWAGGSASDRQKAELSLYVFMLAMNLVNCITDWDEKKHRIRRHCQRLIVASLTVSLFSFRYYKQQWFPFSDEEFQFTTTTVTTTGGPQCQAIHSNVKFMLETVAWVSAMAVLFRIIAKVLTYPCFCEETPVMSVDNGTEPLLNAKA